MRSLSISLLYLALGGCTLIARSPSGGIQPVGNVLGRTTRSTPSAAATVTSSTASLLKYSCTYEQTAPMPGIGATCQIYRGITDENRGECYNQVDFASAAYGGTGTDPPPFKFRPGFQACEHKCAAWGGRIVTCKGSLDSYLNWPSLTVDHQDCLWEDCVYAPGP